MSKSELKRLSTLKFDTWWKNREHTGETVTPLEIWQAACASMEKDIWKQVVEEWEKPWGLSNGESFEVRMRRRAEK